MNSRITNGSYFWRFARTMQTAIDYQQLVTAIGDAVVISGGDGNITLWNPAAERMFGFTEEEALGKSLDVIIPERLRGRHWDGYHKTMSTGQTRYGNDVLRVPAVHKDGRALSIAFTVALLYSPEKALTGIVAVIRDETSRFQEERNLRKRLAELEAQAPAGA
jgi:PAS domain S-box-containing protein